jgi:putative addiction module component (TIGR02574 family)
MTRKAQVIAEQIATLSKKERAEIAYQILKDLDGVPEASTVEINAAWEIEIERRIADVESGKVKLIDGDKVMAQVRNRHKSAKTI